MAETPVAGVNGSILAGVLYFGCSLNVHQNAIVEMGIGRIMWEEIGESAFETQAVAALQRLTRVGTTGTADAASEAVEFHAADFVRRSHGTTQGIL